MIPPVFVIGFQRSGTTLLRVMLDSHPELAMPLDVTGLWFRYEFRLAEYGDLSEAAGRRRLIADLLGDERIQLWKQDFAVDEVDSQVRRPGYPGVIEAFYLAYAARFGKRAWGDKDPGNILRIDVLDRWFPECRVIHILRDGRGACLSHLGQTFGHQDLLQCAEAWREEVWWSRRMGRLLGPDRYAEVRYESLLESPEAELRRLSAFIGLPYSPAMLDYPSRIRDTVPDEKRHIWPLIGEAPRKDNATKWRDGMTPAVVRCFEKRAGPLLEELGYPTSPRPWGGAYATELRFLVARALRAAKARFGARG